MMTPSPGVAPPSRWAVRCASDLEPQRRCALAVGLDHAIKSADCNAKWSAPRKLYSSGINTDPDVVRVRNTDT